MQTNQPGLGASSSPIYGAVAVMIAGLCGLPVAHAQEASAPVNAAPRAILLLDSTEAMRPLFGSETKLLAVSNAIANILPAYEKSLDLGLLVYGHQTSGAGACGTTYLARPVSPLISSEIANILPTLKAKGSSAVRFALESATANDGLADIGGTIILVSGSVDSCGEDPCAAAAAIAEAQAHRVHVIGVDAGDGQTLEPLRCIATQTGGTYRQVTSPVELAAALDQALILAKERLPMPPGPPAAASPGIDVSDATAAAGNALLEDTVAGSAASGAPRETVGNGAVPVRLTALLTDGGPQLATGLTWRIFQKPADAAAFPELIATSKQPVPDFRLPVGEFQINVAFGRANLTRAIRVTGAPMAEQFVLNAGGLRFSAQGTDGVALPPSAVNYDVYSDERDQTGDRVRVIAGARPGAVLRLNAGIYYVASLYGDANALVQAEVSVEAGRLSEAVVTHSGGKVTFKLAAQRGGEALADTRWSIETADGDSVKQAVGALPSHILAAGKYRVEATRGDQTMSQSFDVVAGKPKQVELVLKVQ